MYSEDAYDTDSYDVDSWEFGVLVVSTVPGVELIRAVVSLGYLGFNEVCFHTLSDPSLNRHNKSGVKVVVGSVASVLSSPSDILTQSVVSASPSQDKKLVVSSGKNTEIVSKDTEQHTEINHSTIANTTAPEKDVVDTQVNSKTLKDQ